MSMGTVFQVPWAWLGDAPGQWPHPGLERLKAQGFATAAMALDEHARSIDDPELAAQKKLAILLGTEGDGLAKTTIAGCDYTVCIPAERGRRQRGGLLGASGALKHTANQNRTALCREPGTGRRGIFFLGKNDETMQIQRRPCQK